MQCELCFYWLGGGAMQAEHKTKLGPFISNRDSQALEAVNWCLSLSFFVYSNTERIGCNTLAFFVNLVNVSQWYKMGNRLKKLKEKHRAAILSEELARAS